MAYNTTEHAAHAAKEWLAVKDVCAALGISRHSVYRLIRTGHLRAKNMSVHGSKCLWRIHTHWLDDFKDSIV